MFNPFVLIVLTHVFASISSYVFHSLLGTFTCLVSQGFATEKPGAGFKLRKSMGNRRREYGFAVLYYIDPSRVLLARYHVVDVLFLSEDKPVVNSS